jgi:hypothetical protein
MKRKNQLSAIITLLTSPAATLDGLLAGDHRLSMPSEISMVCLEDTPFMGYLAPQIRRSHLKNSCVTQFVFSSLGRQLPSGISKGWAHRPLVPEFVKGETVGRAPIRVNLRGNLLI